MARLIIEIENKNNFNIVMNLLKKLPFVKIHTAEKKREHTLSGLRKEIHSAREEYKNGQYKTIEQLMSELDV